ncbi:hypothetical protein [Sorangium sp. So ce1078]|uniref:hypothetical protein n=1 Tax=Sorangium sp. So ce1078 TaxID=3133329 RepID=UPI003F5E167F
MRRFIISTLLAGCLSSCTSAPPSTPGDGHVEGPAPVAASCPTQKIAFTRDTGCVNDGSVEFCLPTGDEALLARVRDIAPAIQAGSSRGRARCDVPAETLYLFPTGDAECVARHGALEDAAWDQVCRIAALPEVREIVPTWYE